MTSFRFATIIFIIGAGLVVSYFIIYDSPSDEIKTVSKNEVRKISESVLPTDEKPKTQLQWVENFNSLNKTSGDALTSSNNLTLSLGQEMVEQIKLSPGIFDFEKGNLSAGANLLSNRLINNAFTSNQLGLVFVLDGTVLKTSSNNSTEAKANYLKTVGELNKKNFADFNKSYPVVIYETYGENNPASAVQLADIYQGLAKELSALSAPSDYLELHKRIILSYKNAEVVYRAMANYSQDPIKGYLALEMVQGLIDGIEEVQKVIFAEAKEVNLY